MSLALAFDALKKAHLDANERDFVLGCLQSHHRDERLSFMTSAKTVAIWLLVWSHRNDIDPGFDELSQIRLTLLDPGFSATYPAPLPKLWESCFEGLKETTLRSRAAALRMVYGKQSS